MEQLRFFELEIRQPDPPDQSFINDCEYLVAFSGGKDSVAMVLMLLEMGVAKERITLHHHDVDGHGADVFDWPCTPSYCQAFADQLGLKTIFSWREGGISREIMRHNEGLQDVLYTDGETVRLKSNPGNSTRQKFPAVSADLRTRWCSAVVKIDVLSRVITNHPGYASGKFLVCTGERWEESPARNKYAAWQPYKGNSKTREVHQWRPILSWDEDRVWNIIKRWNIQPHPAYMLGWPRCSCATCIFNSPNAWASLLEIAEYKINTLGQMENALGFTLYNGENIRARAARGKSFIPNGSGFWISQALGEFTAPIITEKWLLPAGAFTKEIAGSV